MKYAPLIVTAPWRIPLGDRPALIAGCVIAEQGSADGQVVVDVHRPAVAVRGVVVDVGAAGQYGGALLDVHTSAVHSGGVYIHQGVCQGGAARRVHAPAVERCCIEVDHAPAHHQVAGSVIEEDPAAIGC